ncbi:hypothetical protein HK405_009957, partial [Cladochytrium tenue]
LSVGANWLYSQLDRDSDDCDLDDCNSYTWSANLYTCTQSDTLIDPTVANSSSLVCFLRHPQLNYFFSAWGVLILLALLSTVTFVVIPDTGRDYSEPVSAFLLFFVVEWFVVLGRDAHSPGIDASLIWCPTDFFQQCQYLDFGTVYPYSLSQSATWFRTMGPYPADKVAGYGMVPGAWD